MSGRQGAAEWEAERVRQHAEFQTQTLLELQDALAQLLSLTQSQMMGEALSSEDRSKKVNANLQAQALAVRVDNNELRARAQGILDLMIELGEARNTEAASAVWNAIALEFRATNDGVGELLRELFSGQFVYREPSQGSGKVRRRSVVDPIDRARTKTGLQLGRKQGGGHG